MFSILGVMFGVPGVLFGVLDVLSGSLGVLFGIPGVLVGVVAEDYKVWRRRPCGMRRTRQEDEILCICYYHSAHCQCETFLLVNPQPLLMVFSLAEAF